jgi:hypothetical protein
MYFKSSIIVLKLYFSVCIHSVKSSRRSSFTFLSSICLSNSDNTVFDRSKFFACGFGYRVLFAFNTFALIFNVVINRIDQIGRYCRFGGFWFSFFKEIFFILRSLLFRLRLHQDYWQRKQMILILRFRGCYSKVQFQN